MQNNIFLQVGDVITLCNDMSVYAELPKKFIYSNAKFSTESAKNDIVIGKKYSNLTDIEEDVKSTTKNIIDMFSRVGFDLDKKDAENFVLSKLVKPKKESFILKGGDFLVTKTERSGGGTGMGSNDIYPDGYKVYCKRLKNGKFDENGTEVSFYQSGCFTAMIKKHCSS